LVQDRVSGAAENHANITGSSLIHSSGPSRSRGGIDGDL